MAELWFQRIGKSFWAPAAMAIVVTAGIAAVPRVLLQPHFQAGQTLYYQFELRATTTGHVTSPVADPEAAKQLEQSASVLVRLDVLSVERSRDAGAGKTRLRATYERSEASSSSDAYDPRAAAVEEQYRKLEGRSLEFTLEPDGRIADLEGLKEILPLPAASDAVRTWLSALSFGAALPRRGIHIGEKWSAEDPVIGAPLAGMAWRTESEYLRNEPCPRPGSPPAGRSSGAPETCAVILTHFKIIQRAAPGDATPEDYLRNGLRTRGKWEGAGDALSSVSLRTGLVVSVTETVTQRMDFTIASASTPSRMRYVGQVHSRSQITLLGSGLPARECCSNGFRSIGTWDGGPAYAWFFLRNMRLKELERH